MTSRAPSLMQRGANKPLKMYKFGASARTAPRIVDLARKICPHASKIIEYLTKYLKILLKLLTNFPFMIKFLHLEPMVSL